MQPFVLASFSSYHVLSNGDLSKLHDSLTLWLQALSEEKHMPSSHQQVTSNHAVLT